MFTPPSSLSVFSRQFLFALGISAFSLGVGASDINHLISADETGQPTLTITSKTPINKKADSPNLSATRDWYGPSQAILTDSYVEYQATKSDADVFSGWSRIENVLIFV